MTTSDGSNNNNTKKTTSSYQWGCMDVYAMAWAGLPNLKSLQLKCAGFRPREPLLSPEAFGVLLASSSMETLYLENCGLLDEHVDVLAEELPKNTKNSSLRTIDMQENYLTDDTLFTVGRMLRLHPDLTLASLNLSGVSPITNAAGNALVDGLQYNRSLQNLELEGTAARYANEFDIPASPHAHTEWFARMDLYIRLNRAYHEAPLVKRDVSDFCVALNSVSDHASGLFHFIRENVQYSVALSPMAKRRLRKQ